MNVRTMWKIIIAGAALLLLVSAGLGIWYQGGGLRRLAVTSPPDYWPTNGWRTNTPEEQGFDSVKLAEGLQMWQESNIPIDSLLIVRNGYVILDAAFFPYDEAYPHDLASVTKSVTTTLIGIAVDQGKIQLDQPLVSFFPDRSIANLDERKKSITVRNLVSMMNGMESGCLEGDEPTLDAMRSQPDWVQAALDRPMASQPGTHLCYDSPGMHLLSAILQKATGMTELEFARQNLFGPLGIQDVVWDSDPQGTTHGWGDLHLKPRDLAKLGTLWLNQGRWEDRQIISVAWVRDSVRAYNKISDDYYGYGWWVSPVDYYAAGRGGQKMRVVPARNTVIVMTGGNLDTDQVTSYLLPLLVRANKPLPENPSGLATLNAMLDKIKKEAAQKPVAPASSTAQIVSGKTYQCDSNMAGVKSLLLEFNESKVAQLHIQQNNADLTWPIGLDGSYLFRSDGQALRGYWQDSQTFTVEIFDIGIVSRQFHFEKNLLVMNIPEIGMTLHCQAQNP